MQEIINKFDIKGKLISYERYGQGHINDTYLLTYENEGKNERYILQRINTNVFPNVEGLMNNVELVTSFLREKIILNSGDPKRETLNLIKTKIIVKKMKSIIEYMNL